MCPLVRVKACAWVRGWPGSAVDRTLDSRVQFPAVPLSDTKQVVRMFVPSVTKQYDLIPVRCSTRIALADFTD